MPKCFCIPLLFLILSITSCNDLFENQPWEVEVPMERRGLNAKYISKLQSSLDSTYSFAVIGDPHFYYDYLEDIMDDIKARGTADFAVVAGDITDQALMQEFMWYGDAMLEHELPFITVIGNHDHLANGREVYELMFGPRNYSFELMGTRFVCFDNVEFESAVPVEYDWFEDELNASFNGNTIALMHIQPTDVQLQGAPLVRLNQIMADTKPEAVFMGHLHSYESQVFPCGTRWTVAPWPRRLEYIEVLVSPDTIIHERRFL